MTLLDRYEAPAGLAELDRQSLQAWNEMFGFHTEQFASQFEQVSQHAPTAAPRRADVGLLKPEKNFRMLHEAIGANARNRKQMEQSCFA